MAGERWTWATVWLGLTFAVLPPACWFGGGERPGATDDVYAVAIGAEVTVRLARGCAGDSGLVFCTDTEVGQIRAASLSSGSFELGQTDATGGVGLVTVRASERGYARLVVDYDAPDGTPHTASLWLRGAEITDLAVRLPCAGTTTLRTVYPVTTGAQLTVEIEASVGDMPLYIGDLDVLDTAGFTPLPDGGDNRRTVEAPAETGWYAWTLSSEHAGEQTVALLVYEPDELGLRLGSEGATFERTLAILEPVVADHPTCIHGRGERAVLDVIAGPCLPVLGGMEISGGLPVDISRGATEIELSGSGVCTLQASLASGEAVTHVAEVTGERRPPPPTPGAALGPQDTLVGGALPPRGACDEALTDGDCTSPLDGDCYLDSDWHIRHADGTGSATDAISSDDLLGVGLVSELRLSIGGTLALGPPKQLTLALSPEQGSEVDDIGCEPERGPRILSLRPLVSGDHRLSLRAANLDDAGEHRYRAEPVSSARFAVVAGDTGEPAPAGEVEIFVDSEVLVEARYQSASGTTLHGIAPLRFRSDDAQAGASVRVDGTLVAGAAPSTVTVASPVAPELQTILVRDASGIGDVDGLADSTLARGTSECVALVPLGAGGAPILGRPPSRPRLSITGAAVVLTENFFTDALCVTGFAEGAATLRVDWGSAARQVTWSIEPAP